MDTVFAATLLAVVEEGSIAGAARRMRLTPGAVSLRIKALERELGTALIGRAGRAIAPTVAARRIAVPLAEIVSRTADLIRIANGDGRPAGELRLGTIATASTGILPALAAALFRHYPGVDLIVEPGTSIELCAQVRDRRLDAAIVVEPPDAIGKGEIFDRWVEEPLVMIAPAALASTDPIALLKRETLIRYDRRGWGGQLVDGWVSTNAPVARSRIELDALDGIEAMVAAGLGVAIVPDWQGRSRAVPGVVTIALPSAPVRQVGLFARRFSHRQELVELLTPTFRANGI